MAFLFADLNAFWTMGCKLERLYTLSSGNQRHLKCSWLSWGLKAALSLRTQGMGASTTHIRGKGT